MELMWWLICAGVSHDILASEDYDEWLQSELRHHARIVEGFGSGYGSGDSHGCICSGSGCGETHGYVWVVGDGSGDSHGDRFGDYGGDGFGDPNGDRDGDGDGYGYDNGLACATHLDIAYIRNGGIELSGDVCEGAINILRQSLAEAEKGPKNTSPLSS